jgi:very-short-patch-repair endonuclease
MANERARKLRREATDAERVFWSRVRNEQLAGAKFRRQHPIGPYIVDFVCLEHRLVVEIDGSQHDEPAQRQHDEKRTAWLNSEGYAVQRYWAWDVMSDVDHIIWEIRQGLSAEVQQ